MIADRLLPLPGSSAVSFLAQHAGDAGIHLSLFDKHPLVCLLDPMAHIGAEALIVFDEKQRGLLYRACRRNPCTYSCGFPPPLRG